MAKERRRVLYEFEEQGRKTQVEFVRVENAVDFNYRVIINGFAKDWVRRNTAQNLKTARFFYEKHRPVILAPVFRVHGKVNFACGRTGLATCDTFTELGRFIDNMVTSDFDGDVGAVESIELTMVPLAQAVGPEKGE